MMSKVWNYRITWAPSIGIPRALIALLLTGTFATVGLVHGQISSAAYRGLGQPDLTRNGLNRVQGTELSGPTAIALDVRGGQTRIYIADTGNHRVLGWADAQAYEAGNAPSVLLGQFSFDASIPLGIGPAGFASPNGLAVDPSTGDLYVADTGNHRVLRFAAPFDNAGQVEPDAVYGQTDMSGRAANGSGNTRNAMRGPMSVAVDRAGNLWVADTGNHRILRYPASVLNMSSPAADIVLGQKDFTDVGANRTGTAATAAGFNGPAAIAFDSQDALYVSDSGNTRVMRFNPPFNADSAAAVSIPTLSAATTKGIAVAGGQLYVALPSENRVLVVSSAGTTANAPTNVFGQSDLNGRDPNTGVHPRATAYTLWAASDVKVDAHGNAYIADTGNNRVLRIPAGSRSADRVWGQVDFSSNNINQVKPTSLNSPSKVVIDYSQEPFALYVSDTDNHRILIWKDSARFRTGDPADLVIGQPDLRTAVPNFAGVSRHPTQSSLSTPTGITVDSNGNLYVADTGNHRVLRFARPVSQREPIAADLVLGQPDFETGTASVTGPASLRSPAAVAIGPDGAIFVSDTGNNRVLEYAVGVPSGSAAVRVYGQPNFSSSVGPRVVSAQTLTSPLGITVDGGFNLYIADSGANRVVMYANTRDAAPSSNAAVVVIGSNRFSGAPPAGQARLQSPSDVALDSLGRIYVADTGSHRIAVFPSLLFLAITGSSTEFVLGQSDATGSTANGVSVGGFATAESFASPAGLFIDRRDTLYVADSGNHRVVHFLKASRIFHGVYSQASALGRGALATIEGTGFADTEAMGQMPLSQSLAEREVVVADSVAAPLLSVTPSLIHLQLPSNTPTGSPRIAVRVTSTAELIAGGSTPVATYAPGLDAKVLNQDNSVNGESSAALRGTTIRLMGTGQGPVSPAIADGEPAPEGVRTVAVPTTDANTCLTRQPSVCVAVGNTFGEIKFSGIAAGTVGVWQLDVRIPDNAPTGNVPVRAVINAVPSNIVTVAIR